MINVGNEGNYWIIQKRIILILRKNSSQCVSEKLESNSSGRYHIREPHLFFLLKEVSNQKRLFYRYGTRLKSFGFKMPDGGQKILLGLGPRYFQFITSNEFPIRRRKKLRLATPNLLALDNKEPALMTPDYLIKRHLILLSRITKND